MNRKLLKLEKIVENILRIYPDSRDDDFKLISLVYYNIHPETIAMNFNEIINKHKELNLPSFESITRARRKVQSLNQDLCNKETKRKREYEEEKYKIHFSEHREREEYIYE